MGLRYERFPWLTDEVSTTDATPTVSAACSYVVPSGAAGECELRLATYTVGGAAVVVGRVLIPFRNVAGTLSLLTAIPLITLGGDAALLATVLDATKSGTTIQPRVTGIALTNLAHWLSAAYRLNT